MDPFFDFDQFTPTPEVLPDTREEKLHLCRLFLAIAAIPVLSLVAQLLVSLALIFLPIDTVLPNWFSIAAGSLCMYAFAMPLSFLIFRTCRPERPVPKKLGFGAMMALLAICFALTMAGGILGSLVNLILSLITGKEISNPVADMTENTPMWAILLFVVILAPILEELFFRKLVIDRLRRYGDLAAVLVSGILFGLMHGNFSQFFYAAALGVVFGIIYCQTGRLRYTVILHIAINFFGSAYSTATMRALGEMPEIPDLSYFASHLPGLLMLLGYYAVYGIAFVASVPCAIWLWKKIRFSRRAPAYSGAQWRSFTLFNPLLWILLIVLLSNFVLNSI